MSTTERETYLAPFADAVLMESQQIICGSKESSTNIEDVSEESYGWEI